MFKAEYKLLVASGSNNLSQQMSNHSQEGWLEIGNHQVTHYLDKNDKDVFQYTQMMFRADTLVPNF